ncbi:MAG: hypothetical protein ACO1OB_33370 [Archangium sp.]
MRSAVVAVLVLSACAPSVPLDSYCGELQRAKCEAAQRCGSLSRDLDCTKREVTGDCVAWARDGFEKKWLRYDAVEAARCIDDVRNGACFTGTALVQAQGRLCAYVIVGPSNEGERCGSCAAGLECRLEEVDRCGYCRKKVVEPVTQPGLGEACMRSPFEPGCEVSTWCAWQPDGAPRCVTRPNVGEPCDGPCVLDAACIERVCRPRGRLHAPCVDIPCEEGLVCIDGRCEAPRNLGSACAGDLHCNSGLCRDGACISRGEGEACRPTTPSGCEPGLACVNFACRAPGMLDPQCRRP